MEPAENTSADWRELIADLRAARDALALEQAADALTTKAMELHELGRHDDAIQALEAILRDSDRAANSALRQRAVHLWAKHGFMLGY
jgi:hypothetical protein